MKAGRVSTEMPFSQYQTQQEFGGRILDSATFSCYHPDMQRIMALKTFDEAYEYFHTEAQASEFVRYLRWPVAGVLSGLRLAHVSCCPEARHLAV